MRFPYQPIQTDHPVPPSFPISVTPSYPAIPLNLAGVQLLTKTIEMYPPVAASPPLFRSFMPVNGVSRYWMDLDFIVIDDDRGNLAFHISYDMGFDVTVSGGGHVHEEHVFIIVPGGIGYYYTVDSTYTCDADGTVHASITYTPEEGGGGPSIEPKTTDSQGWSIGPFVKVDSEVRAEDAGGGKYILSTLATVAAITEYWIALADREVLQQ